MAEEAETFENADAGASTTYPIQAGQIRKGGYIVINDRPCKVVSIAVSKTGKHGHAKCRFVATDIFTLQKREDLVPSTHTTTAPNVNKTEYTVLDIDDDGQISYMDDLGEEGFVALPPDTFQPVADKPPMRAQIEDYFARQQSGALSGDLIISVTEAMDIIQVTECKFQEE